MRSIQNMKTSNRLNSSQISLHICIRRRISIFWSNNSDMVFGCCHVSHTFFEWFYFLWYLSCILFVLVFFFMSFFSLLLFWFFFLFFLFWYFFFDQKRTFKKKEKNQIEKQKPFLYLYHHDPIDRWNYLPSYTNRHLLTLHRLNCIHKKPFSNQFNIDNTRNGEIEYKTIQYRRHTPIGQGKIEHKKTKKKQKTKQNKTKQNKTKQNKTKQNTNFGHNRKASQSSRDKSRFRITKSKLIGRISPPNPDLRRSINRNRMAVHWESGWVDLFLTKEKKKERGGTKSPKKKHKSDFHKKKKEKKKKPISTRDISNIFSSKSRDWLWESLIQNRSESQSTIFSRSPSENFPFDFFF